MLSENILVEGLGEKNWFRVLSLLWEQASVSDNGAGCLFVVYRGLRLLKAIDLATGGTVHVRFTGISSLDRLSEESGYPLVVAVEESALARICGHAQRSLAFDMDYFEQLSLFLDGFKEEWRRTVFTYPAGPSRIPLPPHRVFNAVLRLLLPDSSILLLIATEDHRVWASAALGYRDGDFWLLTSLESVGIELGCDVEGVILREAGERLSEKYGGRAMTCCAELDTLKGVRSSGFPAGALLWARNTSDILLQGFPVRISMAVLLLLCLGSLRGVL